jgi:inner membrane protein
MENLFLLLFGFLLLVGIAAVGCFVWYLLIKIRKDKKGTEEEETSSESLVSPSPKEERKKSLAPLIKSSSGGFLIRLGLAGAISLLMLIPLAFISELTRERSHSFLGVLSGISGEWGREKTLIGPLLVIPYVISYETEEKVPLPIPSPTLSPAPEEYAVSEEGTQNETNLGTAPLVGTYYGSVKKITHERRQAYLTPESLKATGDMRTETRKRGIYEALVFTADVSYEGKFVRPDFKLLDKRTEKVLWEESYLVMGLNEPVSLKSASKLKFDDKEIPFRPGTNNLRILPNGFSAPIDLSEAQELSFSYNFSVSGSNYIEIAPTAQNSQILLSSDWPHPKFLGSGLPLNRKIGDDGFSADWIVPNLVRNYPDFADVDQIEMSRNNAENVSPLREYVVGVGFMDVLNHYSLVTRAVKYALLFIILTFISYLLFEKGPNSGKLSYVHLALIALSLGLFYLVLLALSEHLAFSSSFFLAALLIILMNGSYVLISVKKLKNALVMTLNLTILYIVLYLILHQEDYALLSGAALLTYALCALMFGTRNIGKDNGSAS